MISIIVFFSKLEEKEDEDEKNMELKQIDYLNELRRELQVQRDILQKLSDSISQLSDNETGGLMGAIGPQWATANFCLPLKISVKFVSPFFHSKWAN